MISNWVRFFCLLTTVVAMGGCASESTYVPRLPQQVSSKLLEFRKLPEHRAFAVAVDPNGNYACGVASGASTIRNATDAALRECEAGRLQRGVVGDANLYAIDQRVVYRNMLERQTQ